MSPETDHPRQRTVAELLAAHGDTSGTGRRRRRRQSDASEDGTGTWNAAALDTVRRPAPPGDPRWSAAPPRDESPLLPPRSVLREPVPREPVPGRVAGLAPPTLPATLTPRLPGDRDMPTEQLPRYRDAEPDIDLTGPIAVVPLTPSVPPRDAGPPTQATPMDFDDDEPLEEPGPAGTAVLADPDVVATEDDAGTEDHEFGADPDRTGGVDAGAPARGRGARRRDTTADGTGAGWPVVVMQWVLGAVGGAVLWVSFSYLWQNFTVVAIAAAVVVTVGLVLVVRGLLGGDDRRTTLLAVLVGLLLTASPAVLWLLQR